MIRNLYSNSVAKILNHILIQRRAISHGHLVYECEQLTEDKVQVDFQIVLRKGKKILQFMQRRTKSPHEAYVILKFLTYFFEYNQGLKMTTEDEQDMITMIKENQEALELDD